MASDDKGKGSPTVSSTFVADDEKGRVENIEENVVDTSGIDERKLVRKLDWALIPWLSFLYLLSFLDRTSIGNAKVRPRSSWH